MAEWAGFWGLPHAKWLSHFARFLLWLLKFSPWSQCPCTGLGRELILCARGKVTWDAGGRQAPRLEGGASDLCVSTGTAWCWARGFRSL